MRNGYLIANYFIYYFIFNLISAPFIFGYLYIYEKYALINISIIKNITGVAGLCWFALLLILTYMSARRSSYYGDGIEDAILESVKELIMYVKLALPTKH